MKIIYFAGGCFWGVEAYFKTLQGVMNTQVGYANGRTQHPSYEDVCHRASGHAECVQVEYDETTISLKALLVAYFSIIDPTSLHRQGPDVGSQYRSGIYYADEQDTNCILDVMKDVQKAYKKPLVVEVVPLLQFYDAEEYHQDCLDKNSNGYCHINLQNSRKE